MEARQNCALSVCDVGSGLLVSHFYLSALAPFHYGFGGVGVGVRVGVGEKKGGIGDNPNARNCVAHGWYEF